MALLELKNVAAGYGDELVLKDFNLEVEEGQLVSLLGPSGCGKTTTLRAIAGFVEIREGQFIFDSRDYTGIPTHKRNFGFVFQNYALFPHINVFENIAFGLKLRKIDNQEIEDRVHEMLKIVDLEGFEERYPGNLSGGQQQRVALARALVIEPGLLLLDEPLSNLDAKLRVQMRMEIKRIQQELGITTVYVTHDQEECFSISDQVAIMNQGNIEQLDSPPDIYDYPKTEFVARFVGFEKFFDLNLEDSTGDKPLYRAPNNALFKIADMSKTSWPTQVRGTIRPDNIEMKKGGRGGDYNCVPGEIKLNTFLGGYYQYLVETDLGQFIVNVEEAWPQMGQQVDLYFPEDKIILVN